MGLQGTSEILCSRVVGAGLLGRHLKADGLVSDQGLNDEHYDPEKTEDRKLSIVGS